MIAAWQRAWDSRAPTVSALCVVLAALAASLSGLGNGFALDDVLVIEGRTLVHSLGDIPALLSTAYWELPPDDTLWRPLGLLGFAAQWVLGDGSPFVFHAVSIAVYVAGCLAVLALAWRMLPPLGAFAAGLVFAVHPVHVESVGNIVGQLELWVALALVTAATLYLRARQSDTLDLPTGAGILALAALGLGMKEHAVLLSGILVALELTVLRGAPTPRDGGRGARMLFVLLLAGIAYWLLLRADVVGGLAGDRPHTALKSLGFVERGWLMLGLVPEIARLLVWPARLYADYSPQYTGLHTAPSVAHLPGALLLLLFVAALAAAWRRDRALALGLLWMPLTYSIVSNVVLPTGILLAERTLFLATVGTALVAGALVVRLATVLARGAATTRTIAATTGLALIALAAAHSAERQHAWTDNDTMIAALVTDAPQNFRGHFWLGDELLRRGDLVAGEVAMRRAMARWPQHDGPPLGLALQLQRHGLCEPALRYYEVARALEPGKPTAYFGASGCLLSLGRLQQARRMALAGLATGRSAPAFRFLLYAADSSLAATDSVAQDNWWLRREARRRAGSVP